MHQLGEMEVDAEMMAMCERIISTLDPKDGGYFAAACGFIAGRLPTAEQLEHAEKALTLVQSLDHPASPPDLKECLLRQLTEDMLFYEEAKTLITSHLEDLRDNRMPLIQKQTAIHRVDPRSMGGVQDAQSQAGGRISPRPSFPPSLDVSVERRRRRQVQSHRR